MTEAEIIQLSKSAATRERAFAELLKQYKERLYWHVRRMVHLHEDADDVLQNTFLKIWRGLPNFRGDSKLYTWMYRIASNESITHLKKKQRFVFADRDADAEGSGFDLLSELRADPFFDGTEAELKLQAAIASLPTRQKLVFTLRYYDEMKYDDMSDLLKTSVGSLKASYHHAQKKVEQFLNQN